jgi:ribokinase
VKRVLVIGSLNLDIVAKADHIPIIGETVIAEYGGQFRGGKGANQACALAKLGGDVEMLGAVGNDDAGNYLLHGLEDSGVDVKNIKRVAREPTGQAWIVVNKKGDNSIIVLPGANYSVDIPYIETMHETILKADIIIMQLEIPVETVCYVARIAKKLGKTVILDPAPAVSSLPDELYANTDYIKPNESELVLLTGCRVDEYAKGAERLIMRGVKNVIVSLGAQGVYCHSKDRKPFHKPAHAVEVQDTTAAGDSFLAAFALGLAKCATFDEAIAFAQKIASIVVTRPGAQSSIPCASELAYLS